MAAELVGKWVKIEESECNEIYPDNIEFSDRGIYFASSNPAARYHPIWDAGSYEHLDPKQIKISTATDAEKKYQYSLAGNIVTFKDENGCEIKYRRAS